MEKIKAFSKLSASEKAQFIDRLLLGNAMETLQKFKLADNKIQQEIEEISENAISNFVLPFGIAPNFLINGKIYHIPMVTEESSVLAAAASAAKFWFSNGGFNTKVISAIKPGQIHFTWSGKKEILFQNFEIIKSRMLAEVKDLIQKMESRGGGICSIELEDYTSQITDYYQIKVFFQTADAMGANFINSCLEKMSKALLECMEPISQSNNNQCTIIMSILSNYTPECIAECSIECKIDQLTMVSGIYPANEFAKRYKMAVDIANIDISRAATHNKGIFNGIDAVIIATGNDFRAIEAGGHAYAAKSGFYKSLSSIELTDKHFKCILQIPLSLGTIGGLTQTHPMAKLALEILQKPSAEELMQIVASVGMASNFSAIKALVTSGIQKGHMKMHLNNILKQLNANAEEIRITNEHFQQNTISFSAVHLFLNKLRSHAS